MQGVSLVLHAVLGTEALFTHHKHPPMQSQDSWEVFQRQAQGRRDRSLVAVQQRPQLLVELLHAAALNGAHGHHSARQRRANLPLCILLRPFLHNMSDNLRLIITFCLSPCCTPFAAMHLPFSL